MTTVSQPHSMPECQTCGIQHCKTCYLLRQVQLNESEAWPSSDRIDVIGQNGNEGIHYNYDKCVRYPDDE